MKAPQEETLKVDSDIQSYQVSDSGQLVTYLKKEWGLYQYQLSSDSKDKIASDVQTYYVSDDGSNIVYRKTGNDLYMKCADQEPEKIDSEIGYVSHVSADCATVYYIKDENLYKKTNGQDKVKIASEVYRVLKIYDSGEVYYLTRSAEDFTLMDYVNDDKKLDDATVFEPPLPNYPPEPYASRWSEEYEQWEEEVKQIGNEYLEAYNAYSARKKRDDLREKLQEISPGQLGKSLCYYDGSVVAVLAEHYMNDEYEGFLAAENTPVITYKAYELPDIEKVNLSQINSVREVQDMIQKALSGTAVRYIAVKGNPTGIDQAKNARCFAINPSGTLVYYLDDLNEGVTYGDLYRVSVSGDSVGAPELYDTDVSSWYAIGDYSWDSMLGFISDTQLRYYKDCSDSVGELYINREKIDTDVYIGRLEVYPELQKIFYYTDWSQERGDGTLKVYDGKVTVKIADDVTVAALTVTPDGKVLYLYDYSIERCYGELYQWADGETRKLDDDVVYVFPVTDV